MSSSTKRLLKESTELYKNPSPYFTAAPVSDTNLHDWHFTLAGPPSPTPYARGLYHGRITFPPTYPLRPPSFRFLTPSGRFEVNREICLSISGHHEETWQPAWGVRTALLAIRSEIMGGESKGQVGGMEGSEGVRREFARVSGDWVCRECGESNREIMRRLWADCVDRGVEVDVEGFEGGRDADGGSSDEKGEDNEGEEEEGEGGEGVQTPSQSQSLSVSAPVTETITPAPSLRASTGDAAAQSQSMSAAMASNGTTATPNYSPWLDRAIVAIFFALIVLVLRRVTGVNDL